MLQDARGDVSHTTPVTDLCKPRTMRLSFESGDGGHASSLLATLAASFAHVFVVSTSTRYALFVTSAAFPTAQTDVVGHAFPLEKWGS